MLSTGECETLLPLLVPILFHRLVFPCSYLTGSTIPTSLATGFAGNHFYSTCILLSRAACRIVTRPTFAGGGVSGGACGSGYETILEARRCLKFVWVKMAASLSATKVAAGQRTKSKHLTSLSGML